MNMVYRSSKITVITPTYNCAQYIEETIESVLKQNYKNFEYLILDDGSTDNTEDLVKPYLKDKRVKYLKHKNSGEAKTVNWGWSMARGKYFTQVNSDDPIMPNLFSEMVKTLNKEKNIVVAYPDFYFIDCNGEIVKKEPTPDWKFENALSNFSCYAASAGTFIKKEAFKDFKKIKNTKFKYISDIDMYWRMALKGNFKHIPKFLATWREHEDSISSKRYKSISEIEIWFKEYFNNSELPKHILNCKNKTRLSIDYYELKLLKKSDKLTIYWKLFLFILSFRYLFHMFFYYLKGKIVR